MKIQRLFPFVSLALVLLSDGAGAQTAKVYRIGFLGPTNYAPGSVSRNLADGITGRLGQLGYTLGRNLEVEQRGAEMHLERLPALVAELVASKVDVIVTNSYPAAAAAQLAPKRLAFLKETVPSLKRVAMLYNADDLGMTLRYEASMNAAKELGVTVQPLGVREPDDFEQAFAAMNADMPDAIFMVSDSLTVLNRKRVFEYAAAHRLPCIFEYDFIVRDGGLMSYGPDGAEAIERAAYLIDRILNGVNPADLPLEQPTRFRFVINLKTAKALGLTIPPTLLARADEVIE